MKSNRPLAWGTAAALLVITLAASCKGDSQTPSADPVGPNEPPVAPPPPPPGPKPSADVVVTIDASQRFQTIEGFGTSMRVFSDPHLTLLPGIPENVLRISEAAQRQILDSLYVGIGLTRVRILPETRGIEPVNDNADPSVTNLSKFNFQGLRNDAYYSAVRELRSRGVTTWWISPVVIEEWMNPGNPEENVEWAMAIIRRWRDEGLEFPYYSILNEPTYVNSGGPWPPEYIRDVVKLLGRKLKAEGFRTKIVIPDDLNAAVAAKIARVVLADAEARSHVAAMPFHLYGESLSQEPELKVLGQQYGIPLWMSEHFVGNGMAWALSVHEQLADHNVSAVDYMWGFFGELDKAQLVSLLNRGTEYLGFRMQPQFHTFGHYSKYVRPGAVRAAATVQTGAIKASAFVREGRMAIVAINPGTTALTVRFDIAGHTNSREFSSVRTLPFIADGDRMKPQPPLSLQSNSIVAVLAPQSVSTFFQ